MAQCLGLLFLSHSSYHKNQKTTLFPVIRQDNAPRPDRIPNRVLKEFYIPEICETFAQEYNVTFNAEKTQCIRYG